MSLDTLTQSRLRAFRKCRRYHKLRYLDGIRSATASEPQSFGTLVHHGLESWWKSGTWTLEGVESDPIQLIKAEEVLEAYTVHAWFDRAEYDVLAVERPVMFPLINPETMQASRTYEMGAVLDLVLKRRATGEVILVEHKTTGADFSDDAADYWRRLAMDSQLSIYVVGCEASGFPVDRIIYDVIARPQIRLKLATPVEARRYTKKDGKLDARQRETDETPEEFRERLRADIAERPERYYGRREIARMESELHDGMLDVWQEAKAIREAELSGRHPRNPDACHVMGTCEMYDLCAYRLNPDESTLYRRVDDKHTELTRAFAALEVTT
jgi:hypothetical protein